MAPTTRRARPTSDRRHGMGRGLTIPVVLAGLIVLAAGGPAWAQTEFFGLKLDGSVEGGVGGYIYALSAALFLEAPRLRLSTKDDRYFLEFKAKEAGEEDQEFGLRSSRLGFYEF